MRSPLRFTRRLYGAIRALSIRAVFGVLPMAVCERHRECRIEHESSSRGLELSHAVPVSLITTRRLDSTRRRNMYSRLLVLALFNR